MGRLGTVDPEKKSRPTAFRAVVHGKAIQRRARRKKNQHWKNLLEQLPKILGIGVESGGRTHAFSPSESLGVLPTRPAPVGVCIGLGLLARRIDLGRGRSP
mmetsp:Transcript_19773/g.27596  ORF Transcript_19773/g.27596 Transcript_19773/m.27596 type:complete len:101 (+) Transcript_19773:103-405(+)